MGIFVELSFIILLAAAFAAICHMLRQPLIVGYILAGIFAGPYFLNVLRSSENIELFSKIGITILLFIVGLSLSPKVIKDVGKVSLVTGVGQVVFTSVVGFLIALGLGIEKVPAIYIAIALTFSSTIIILKLLSDKGDLNKLYGRIAIGFLLVQDIIATIILVVVSTMGQAAGGNVAFLVFIILIKALAIGVGLYLLATEVLPKLSRFLASSQELLFLFSIGWGLILASIFHVAGFSVEIGALVAGVTLSTTPFATEIGSRMKPLRDFFIVLFFILLGSHMVLEDLGALLWPATVFSLFVLIGNPLIVVILMNLLGYKKRTGFMAGLTVAQISEFSLILAALGLSVGHLDEQALSLVTLVGLITISGSTYLIMYSDKIYPRVEKLLKLLEFRKRDHEQQGEEEGAQDVILFGYNRVGADFVSVFKKLRKKFLVVDINPQAIEHLISKKIPCRYGDAEDLEFLQELGLEDVKLVVSTIPDFEANMLLIKKVRQVNRKSIIIVISHDTAETNALYKEGATYVAMPHYLGAAHVSSLIKKHGLDLRGFGGERRKHLTYLRKRSKLSSV